MKIVARPIKTLAVFQYDDGTPMPYKFKIKGAGGDPEEETTVKVSAVLRIDRTRIAGKESIVYHCQSFIGDMEKRYELKYIIPECRWVLYKM